MNIVAHLKNSEGQHVVLLRTDDHAHSIEIPPKLSGYGSSANGGELLCLALATCYCNDIYREAYKCGIKVDSVEVSVEGEFGAEGAPARHFVYQAKVRAQASDEEIRALMNHTDQVAEIQNTLRQVTPVVLRGIEVLSTE